MTLLHEVLAHMRAGRWREAHNLVQRARQMYSAELERGALRAARAVAPPCPSSRSPASRACPTSGNPTGLSTSTLTA